jgi:Pathogenicity locus
VGQPKRAERGTLESIPGVGPRTAEDLSALGVTSVQHLVGADPEALYARLCALQGGHSDRCNLYVYRCAVYYARGGRDAELLKWWSWKDAATPPLELLGR